MVTQHVQIAENDPDDERLQLRKLPED